MLFALVTEQNLNRKARRHGLFWLKDGSTFYCVMSPVLITFMIFVFGRPIEAIGLSLLLWR